MHLYSTPFYQVKAVARMLNVSPATVYRLINRGELGCWRVGSSIRVPESAVRAYLVANGGVSGVTR